MVWRDFDIIHFTESTVVITTSTFNSACHGHSIRYGAGDNPEYKYTGQTVGCRNFSEIYLNPDKT